jgi:hypothetical protein
MSPANNKPVPGIDSYFVLNEPESGVLLPAVCCPPSLCLIDQLQVHTSTEELLAERETPEAF